jgi:hypothetical protein
MDIEMLIMSVQRLGHKAFPVDWNAGNLRYDIDYDNPPYRDSNHIKLEMGGYIATSFMMIFQKV